ncbi:SRPBCC family protein [Shewanella surugensis]|uniref:SRPBCC family protein n=1 Tax=Shewanella surugensis TaxID=212020 RepID=A0ABT0LHW0_9GAMM|nr:SRPBCC family protein [Shewanella surugensis]MCL1127164.1 SRPBCC family protein [Shewanella surugensis]
MSTVTVTQLFNVDIETVWAQIADVTLISNWHPSVDYADLLSPHASGMGATRRCNFYDGTNVIEEVVNLDRKHHSFSLQIREFKGPINRFDSHWTLRSTPSGATQITVVMDYDMKLSILGAAMNVLMIKGNMAKRLNKLMQALGHHLKTGELIDQHF